MQLNELLAKFVADTLTDGQVSKKAWATAHLPTLDKMSTTSLALDGLMTRLATKMRTIKMEIGSSIGSAQQELPFDLPFAVAINPTETTIKSTASLTRAEMDWAIEIRQKQVRADQLRLSEFVAARRAAEPFWDAHPEWTFGECIAAYLAPVTVANDNYQAAVAA